MTLNVTTEPREGRQLAVSIEVPQERVDRELRKAASKLASQYRLPGFRAGKAPYSIVVQQFGLASLYSDFVDELGQEMFKQAIEQENIEPYAMASLDDVQFEPMVYRLTVPLEPIVTLGDYRSIRLEEPPVETDESLIEQRLEQMREQYSSWQTVERPSEFGDMMTIDVKSVISGEGGEAGAEIIVLDETDWDVTPDEENPMDPPGFDAALLGLAAGESRQFALSWPADSQSIHAGKEATFSVTVKEIQAYQKPPLDDSLAPMIGPDFETLDDVRKNLRENLTRADNSRRKQEFLDLALDTVIEMSTLEYPPAVVEDQLDSMMLEFERRLRLFGLDNLDRYFEQIGQTREEYRETLREQASLQARRNLILSELVRAEQVLVTDADIDARLEEIKVTAPDEDASGEASAFLDLLRSPTGRGIVTHDILRERTVDRLLAIVRGEPVPPPGEGKPSSEGIAEIIAEVSAETPAADGDSAPEGEASTTNLV